MEMEKIINAVQQVVRVNKVNGMGWLVFANVECRFAGKFQKSFMFFKKSEAIEFCKKYA